MFPGSSWYIATVLFFLPINDAFVNFLSNITFWWWPLIGLTVSGDLPMATVAPHSSSLHLKKRIEYEFSVRPASQFLSVNLSLSQNHYVKFFTLSIFHSVNRSFSQLFTWSIVHLVRNVLSNLSAAFPTRHAQQPFCHLVLVDFSVCSCYPS